MAPPIPTGKANEEVSKGNIIAVASYPKSGNTWVRIFLQKIMLREQQKSTVGSPNLDQAATIINDLRSDILFTRHNIESQLGYSISDFSSTQIEQLLSSYTTKLSQNLNHQTPFERTFKVHDALVSINGIQRISAKSIDRVIYIVRNPYDVAWSYSQNFGLSIDSSIDWMSNTENYLSKFGIGIDPQIHQVISSWNHHVKCWSQATELSCLLIRYEDLISTPINTFGQIASFLDIEIDEENLSSILSTITFEKLRALELESGFRENGGHQDTFFRKGIVGDGFYNLSPNQRERVSEDHFEMLLAMDYLNQKREPTSWFSKALITNRSDY